MSEEEQRLIRTKLEGKEVEVHIISDSINMDKIKIKIKRKKGDQRSLLSKGLMELVGTSILLCTAQTINAVSPASLANAVGGVLIGIIYMGFDLSGAHYNPVVTLIFILREKCSFNQALVYIPMQLIGGTLGCIISKFIVPVYFPFQVGVGFTLWQAIWSEFFFTFLLCFSILTVALRKDFPLTPVFGIAIVGVIYAGISCVGTISGAAFNPAVAFAAAIVNGGSYKFAVIVSIVTTLAGFFATLVFYTVAPEELEGVSWGKHFISSVETDEEEYSPLLGDE